MSAGMKQAADLLAAHSRERTYAQLAAAVRTARDAAEAAERAITHNTGNPAAAITGVLHALSWGNANAMSSIQTAIAVNGDEHAARLKAANEPSIT